MTIRPTTPILAIVAGYLLAVSIMLLSLVPFAVMVWWYGGSSIPWYAVLIALAGVPTIWWAGSAAVVRVYEAIADWAERERG